METHTRRSHKPWSAYAAAVVTAVTLAAPTGRAAEHIGDAGITDTTDATTGAIRHVRTLDSRLDALIAAGTQRSPMFRTLVDRLDRSTVFVYVQARLLPGQLTGRLTVLGSAERWRYLRVEIECRQSIDSQIAALGHELQHAVEIAGQAAALDLPSIRALYRTIGFEIDDSRHRFESDAAKEAGNRVRRELSRQFKTSSSDSR